MRRLLLRLAVMLLRMSRRACRCRRCELRRAAAVERWKAKTLTYRDLAEPSEPEPPTDPAESIDDTEDLGDHAPVEPAERRCVDDQDGDEHAEPDPHHGVGQVREVHGPTVNPWHAAVMEDFYAARQTWQDSCDTYSKGYETEAKEFERLWPRPQLRDFLIDHAARARAEIADMMEVA